jgi:putative endopeptidase
MRKFWYIALAIPALLQGCSQKSGENSDTENKTNQTYISIANMDTTVAPGDNFYKYVNGTWLKNAVIPPTESSIGGFLDIYNKTKTNLRVIIEEAAAAKAAPGTVEQLVGDLYASGIDSVAINKLGKGPMQPYLDKVAALKSNADVLRLDASLSPDGYSSLLGGYIGVDEKRSTHYIFSMYQTGLGLPDRDYYFKTDPATLKVVKAYQTYLTTTFTLLGDDSIAAKKNAKTVYELEKTLAASHRDNIALRNPQLNYNKWSLAETEKKYPNLSLGAILKNAGVMVDSVNVSQPDYYAKLNELIKTVPLATWQTYLRFWVTNEGSRYLSQEFVDARFAYSSAISGQKQIKPRWERIYRLVDEKLGEPLGQLYVKKHFTPEAKKRMDELVSNLEKAFEVRITKLDWMSDTTKVRAKAKLATIIKKIGYPDKFRDLSKLKITRDNYLGNVAAINRENFAFEVSKLGKPVDKTEWGMSASTVNAYYNPTINEIVFPAGILQFPMFDLGADDAINYGAIGVVIGHEITHGFDDQGAQYDKDGNLKNWWAASDNEKFKAKGELVVQQYNGYTVLDTVHIKGALTLGENMADLGGVTIAYDAFKMTKQGQSNEKIDGFTPDQRFFLGFAGSWRSKDTDEGELSAIQTDPHSPPIHRVNGPLSNFTPFYMAFNVKEGNKMYKPEAERIKIW